MKHALLALTSLGLAFPAAAQDSDSPLVIRTSFINVANEFAIDMFDGESVADLGEGQHYVLSLTEDGDLDPTMIDGEAPMLELSARPIELMDIFADEVLQAQQQIQGFAVMGMSQGGISSKDALLAVRAVFEFPYQIENAKLTIHGDPDRPEKGYKVRINLVPAEGSWFASLVGSVNASEGGAPDLSTAGSMLSVTAATTLTDKKPWEPLMNFGAAFGSKGKEQRARRTALGMRSLESMGDAMSFAWSDSGIRALFTVSDADKLKEVMADPEYIEWSNSSAGGSETEYDAEAFEHRGVTVAQSTTEIDGPGADIMPGGGVFEMFQGVAGNYFFMTGMGSDADSAKAMIDTALAGEFEMKPMAEGVFVDMKMQAANLIDYLSGGMAPADEMPELIGIRMGKADGAMTLAIDIG